MPPFFCRWQAIIFAYLTSHIYCGEKQQHNSQAYFPPAFKTADNLTEIYSVLTFFLLLHLLLSTNKTKPEIIVSNPIIEKVLSNQLFILSRCL